MAGAQIFFIWGENFGGEGEMYGLWDGKDGRVWEKGKKDKKTYQYICGNI